MRRRSLNPSELEDFKAARDCIREICRAFEEGTEDEQKIALRQARLTHTQLAANSGRRNHQKYRMI